MPSPDWVSLWRTLDATPDLGERWLQGSYGEIKLDGFSRGSCLGGQLSRFNGRSVLLVIKDQLTAAMTLIELDGVARRMVLCPPDTLPDHLAAIAAAADADAVVTDQAATSKVQLALPLHVEAAPALVPMPCERANTVATEWVLLTSGTSGLPKLVLHSLASLAGPLTGAPVAASSPVWSTFYDIRRYGGLQIFLRAMLGGGSLVLSDSDETTADFIARAESRGVTHVSGTPSHWRRALMSPAIRSFQPSYVRLSGEIADQSVLEQLRQCFPAAVIAHAYASTEAGVGFDVIDGRSGFPASLLTRAGTSVDMKIEDGSLRIRSDRTASRYLGAQAPVLRDGNGFVDTGDMIEAAGDRLHFAGRRGGIINVGGAKVHPEEVEAIICRHPAVRMSLVRARKNPITGAVVVADVVLHPQSSGAGNETLASEILDLCRAGLPAHKVPTTVRFVPSLAVAASGKLVRPNA